MTRAELAPEVRDLWRRVYAATCSGSAAGAHEHDYLARVAAARADRAVDEYLRKFGDEEVVRHDLGRRRDQQACVVCASARVEVADPPSRTRLCLDCGAASVPAEVD